MKLQQLIQQCYSYPSYEHLNDRLTYIDHIDRYYEYPTVLITPMEAYRFQGNLFGVFQSLNLDPGLWGYAMYLNNYTNPSHYEGKQVQFKIPRRVPMPEY